MSEFILVIEEQRNEIQHVLSMPLSCYKKLSLLSNFFSLLISTNNKNVLQAYGTGLIEQYSMLLFSGDISGVNPIKHKTVIETAEAIISSNAFPAAVINLEQSLASFKVKVNELADVLNGKDAITLERNNYIFPLVDTTNDDGELYGMLDSVTVKITKEKQQVFHIIPSEKEIETRIKTQIETSWNVAVAYARKYIKHISPHHEVIVSFDKRVGFYVGDSLGVVLTLAYIHELFLFYNASLTITAKEGSCFTGSLLQNGEIPSIGKENIAKKAELVFYSAVKTFVLPKEDEPAAEEKLRELKKEYPNRSLKLIVVTDIEDLLSRRNVVDIKKLSIVKRTGKTVARNKLVTVLLVFLFVALFSFYFYEYDDNPYGYEVTPAGFNIINQSGKVLWTIKRPNSNYFVMNPSVLENCIRVIDLNGDKRNEAIYWFNSHDVISDKKISEGIAFYDYKGKVFNRLAFTKTVYSKREVLTPPYGWALQDTLTFKGRKSILACANNGRSYASAAFLIDLKTQQIISDTLWNCGQYLNIKAVDLNDDGEKEIVGIAINNGKEKSSFFYLELSKFGGQIPSADEYRLFNIKEAEVNRLFLLPKTDFAGYNHMRWSGLNGAHFGVEQNTKTVSFGSVESPDAATAGISYSWKFNTNEFIISIGGTEFRVERDSLVAQWKLKKPFTDTWEYRQLIHDQILQWNGKDFVSIKK